MTFDNANPKTNDVLTAQVNASDGNNDAISLTYVWTVGGFVVQTTTTTSLTDSLDLSQPGYGDKGDAIAVTVTATTNVGSMDIGTPVTISTTVANSTPVIDASNLTSLQSFTGDVVSLQINATDADGDTIVFGVPTGLPAGLSMDNTGLITGAISASANTTVPYSVTVTADDGTGTGTQAFDWTIVQAFVVVVQGDQDSIAGQSVSLPLYSWALPGHTLIYALSGQPTGLGIDTGTGEITGTIAYGQESASPYAVTITATDTAGGVVGTATLDWFVNAPEILAFDIGDLESIVGATVDVTIEAWSTEGGTVSFSQVGLPPGLGISGTGEITGTIASNADLSRPYGVTITATNAAAGISTNITFNWTIRQLVLRAPEDQANLIGDTVSLPVVAPYAGTGTLYFTISGQPYGVDINHTTGEIYGTITSTADATLPYAVTVTVTDGPLTVSKTFNWEVKKLFVNDPGDQFSLNGDAPSFTFAVIQLSGHTITYAASDLPTGLTVNDDTGVIEGTIDETAHDDGPFNVTVTATDTTINVTASKTFTWVVDAPGFVSTPVPPVPVAPNPNRIARLQANIDRDQAALVQLYRMRNLIEADLVGSLRDWEAAILAVFGARTNAERVAASALMTMRGGIVRNLLQERRELGILIPIAESNYDLSVRLLFRAEHPDW